jgi:hypothetical protein
LIFSFGLLHHTRKIRKKIRVAESIAHRETEHGHGEPGSWILSNAHRALSEARVAYSLESWPMSVMRLASSLAKSKRVELSATRDGWFQNDLTGDRKKANAAPQGGQNMVDEPPPLTLDAGRQ